VHNKLNFFISSPSSRKILLGLQPDACTSRQIAKLLIIIPCPWFQEDLGFLVVSSRAVIDLISWPCLDSYCHFVFLRTLQLWHNKCNINKKDSRSMTLLLYIYVFFIKYCPEMNKMYCPSFEIFVVKRYLTSVRWRETCIILTPRSLY